MVDTDRIKALKERSKKTIKKRNLRPIILALIIIIIFGMLFIVLSTVLKPQQQNIVVPNLEQIKNNAKKAINEMFKPYPNDPMKNVFLGKIDAATSEGEIKSIINEAQKYIQNKNRLENAKKLAIEQIKNSYGSLLEYSDKAKKAINEINLATSIDEINKILNSLNENIEEDKKEIVDNIILKSLYFGDKYYYVKAVEDNQTIERFLDRNNLIKFKNTLDYKTLKNLIIQPVSEFKKVALEVSAKQCGDLPVSNSVIAIYNTKGNLVTYALVDSSYVVLSNINYGESKSASENVNTPVDQYSTSQSSNVNYNLNNLPGVLQATVIGKLDYYKIKQMFGEFGYKLNKLSKETQIFDDKMNYLLILLVPDDGLSKLLKENKNNLVITVQQNIK
ncbi:DUF515 domain-containing protein [Methanocaldococcus sp.]